MAIVLPRDFKELLKSLNSNLVEHLLIGGYAADIYGYVRATNGPHAPLRLPDLFEINEGFLPVVNGLTVFGGIARPTKRLDILYGIRGPGLGNGDDVIPSKLSPSPAARASVVELFT
jgi:hypothetical protein